MYDQLNLFENRDLISGLNSVNDLKWEKGLRFLKKETPLQEEDKVCVEKAKETALYWKDKLGYLRESEKNQHLLKDLLIAYRRFEFVDRLYGARKKIRAYLVEEWIKSDRLTYDLTIQFFFLLMENADYGYAEKLMLAYLQKEPKELKLYYLLGQAEWCNGHKGRAKGHYLQAFLHYPDRLMMRYVESPKLIALTETYPLYMIPAYAWLKGITPFVTVIECQSFDREQEDSCIAYKLLKKCHTALKAKKDPLPYRKKLKQVAPELLADYLNQKRR